MRFKYLTATILREAANAILAHERGFMCTAIRDFGSEEARMEFEQVLEEMQVSKCGNLLYFISPDDEYMVKGDDGGADQEKSAIIRAFFMYMLADAIAYKAPKKKKLTYDQWKSQVNEIAAKEGLVPMKNPPAREIQTWVTRFEKGMTPQEAWDSVPYR